MLSKQVCKKCWGCLWGKLDEERWKSDNSIVFCCVEAEDGDEQLFTHRNQPPPAHCPFKMEHGIAESLANA